MLFLVIILSVFYFNDAASCRGTAGCHSDDSEGALVGDNGVKTCVDDVSNEWYHDEGECGSTRRLCTCLNGETQEVEQPIEWRGMLKGCLEQGLSTAERCVTFCSDNCEK